MRKYAVFVALLVLAFMVSGCYWNRQVEEYEVGLKLADGVKIEQVLGPGRHTAWGFYDDLIPVNVSALTVVWEDPDLVTKDKQPIEFKVSATFARERSADSVTSMWQRYNSEARDDEVLKAQVLTRIPRVAKRVTTLFTLDQMLGVGVGGEDYGRQIVQDKFFEFLNAELNELYVDLYDVGINNIGPDPKYLDLLKEKANSQVAVEVAKEKTKQLNEELNQEKAQTNIDLEVASRQRRVEEERAKVYEGNDRWFRLKELEAIAGVIGSDDKWWFVEPGVDLTLLIGSESVVPVETNK